MNSLILSGWRGGGVISYNIPYKIKRIFYTYNIDIASIRGNHANINSSFVFVALRGQCKIAIDDGNEKNIFALKKYTEALNCKKMTWKEIYDYSQDCVLLSISDMYYDKNEYINDYNNFLNILK